MKIRRFYGKDMREALKQVKDELGDDAVIMSNKKLSDGVEIVAAYDKEPVHAPKRQQAPTTPEPKRRVDATPTLSEIIGDSGPDSLRALLENRFRRKSQRYRPIPTYNLAQLRHNEQPPKAKHVNRKHVRLMSPNRMH